MPVPGPSSPDPFQQVEVYCEARVGGETLRVQMNVASIAWHDDEAREVIEGGLRMRLMEKILENWTPVVYTRW